MAKKTKSYNLLLIGVLGLLAVGTWVVFDIYRGLTTTTLTEVQQKTLLPLRVSIDEEFVTRLQARRQFSESVLNTVSSKAVPLQEDEGLIITPTPTLSEEAEVSEATSSAEIEQDEEATNSGLQ